jgi:hypothetical protein
MQWIASADATTITTRIAARIMEELRKDRNVGLVRCK